MTLGLFFTKNVSLEIWVESGLIDREKTIYEYHLQQGLLQKVYWFTYGIQDDKYYRELIQTQRLDPRIIVISPSKLFEKRVWRHCYWWMLPFMYRRLYRQLDIVKSNQCPGAMMAWLVSKLYKIPFYFRTGYTDSSIYPILNGGKRDRQYRKIQKRENFLYHKCAVAAVSSQHDKQYVCKEYGIPESKVKLVRNFIDTNCFQNKAPLQNRLDKIVYIGRLAPVKNLLHIICAVNDCNLSLDIYGRGDQKKELEELVQNIHADVHFKGVVPNYEIPDILNKYKYYILASTYEGMPKTLLEAMACGCICIGTPVEGISEVIEDDVNGFLAKGTDTENISEAIRRASMFQEKEKISDNACELIRSTYALREIAEIDKTSMLEITKKMLQYDTIGGKQR